jgi:hypothetical protein
VSSEWESIPESQKVRFARMRDGSSSDKVADNAVYALIFRRLCHFWRGIFETALRSYGGLGREVGNALAGE